MKFFGSSLAMANNLKVAFLGKKMFSKENCSTSCPLLYLVINITDGLSRVFLNLLFYLATAVERKISILLRGLPKEQVQSATKISNCKSQLNTAGQCQIYWKAGPQNSAQVFCNASAQNSGTVSQDWQLWKAWTNYQTYIWIVDFFSKNATFELSLMSNDENKFQPIFQIQQIKNALFLLELDMALVTTIEMRFAQVCFWITLSKI